MLALSKCAVAEFLCNFSKHNTTPMKITMVTLLFLLPSLFSTAQTQSEMNADAYSSYLATDNELNMVYDEICIKYKNDTAFLVNLKIAQRAWIQFRDADVNARYPNGNKDYYGSVFPMCHSMYLQSLTEKRISELKLWLDGLEEGDVCSGSVRIKE